MTTEGSLETAKLRPHHVFCETFLNTKLDRGGEFEQVKHAIKELVTSYSDAMIEITQGIDQLCRSCPNCRNNRCESQQGNEDEVRKWDAIILKGLGIDYGEKKTAQQLRTLIQKKAPLDFCRTRCPWKKNCSVFELG